MFRRFIGLCLLVPAEKVRELGPYVLKDGTPVLEASVKIVGDRLNAVEREAVHPAEMRCRIGLHVEKGHPLGQASKALLESSRLDVFRALGLRGTPAPGELLFTASGTEADNLAILGSARAKERRRGGRILSTDSEHPALENALEALEKEGYDVVRIPTKGGTLDFDAFEAALTDKVFLVTMMLVNNETGAIYDVEKAFRMAKAKNNDIVTHTDAVQAFLKLPFSPSSLHADLVSISSHKIGGPKGVGALYVSADARRRRDLVPILQGGGQEAGFRSGTENLIGISGFAAAARAGKEALAERASYCKELSDLLKDKLASLEVSLNLPPVVLPQILNLTLPNIRSETMLHELSKSGICISQGSACSSHDKHLSRALLSFGLSPDKVECSLRISLSHENTKEEIDLFVVALEQALKTLVRVKR